MAGCTNLINKMAFHPDKFSTIDKKDLPQICQETFLKTKDNLKLQTYLFKNKNSKKIVIFFHGNAGNLNHRISDALKLFKMNLNVLLVSYRGYAKSEGSPSEKGIYLDGFAALNYVKNNLNFKTKYIYLYGRSIGSTVAVHIAQNIKLAGVILISPLTSGKEIAQSLNIGLILSFSENPFNSLKKIKNIKSPVLFIHGDRDNIIPYSMGKKLFNNCPTDKKFITIKNAGHNDLSLINADLYWNSIKNFITGCKADHKF